MMISASPGAVLDDIDGELEGGGEAADCPIHSLSDLPDLDLVGLGVRPRHIKDTVTGGTVTCSADSHCLVTPASIRHRPLVICDEGFSVYYVTVLSDNPT